MRINILRQRVLVMLITFPEKNVDEAEDSIGITRIQLRACYFMLLTARLAVVAVGGFAASCWMAGFSRACRARFYFFCFVCRLCP